MKFLYLPLALALLTANCTFTMQQATIVEPELTTINQMNGARVRHAAIRELFDAQDGLSPNGVKELIADYSAEGTFKILLRTPPKLPFLFGCARWKPYYPPIKALQFIKNNTLQATAPGVEHDYNFVINWNLTDGSCAIAYKGYRSEAYVCLRDYKMTHNSLGKLPVTDSHNELSAAVKTECTQTATPRQEPQIIYRTQHIVQLTAPKSLLLKSILLNKPYTACNKPAPTAQTPQA